jgi:hypothetical protein
MAIAGQRAVATVVRLATGRRSVLPQNGPAEPDGPPEKPAKFKGRISDLWNELCGRAPWLTVADSYKMAVWCKLYVDFERSPKNFTATMHGHLRNAGSELGLDPMSRARIGQGVRGGKKADPAAKYLDGG